LADEPRAIDVRMVRVGDTAHLVVALHDGRVVSTPLTWYPTLAAAKPAERRAWVIVDRGLGVSWPDLDVDLSVRGMLRGQPDTTRAARAVRPRASSYTAMLRVLRPRSRRAG
jgi:hypothetical protein